MLPRPSRQLALAAWLAATGAARLESADLAEVRARGSLRFAVSTDSLKGLVNLNPSGPPGLEREIVEQFAAFERIKLEVVTIPGGVSDRIDALLKGRADVIAGVTDTAERRQIIDFTAEVFPVRHIVVTRRPRPPVLTLQDLRTRTIAVLANSTQAHEVAAAGVPADRVRTFATGDEVVAALRTEKAAAAVISTIRAFTTRKDDPDIEFGMFLGTPQSSSFGVRKEDGALRTALSDYMVKVRLSGGWSRLVVKYFGEEANALIKASAAAP
jgi:ABC-type amino acid transport substrate-binding protein